MDSTIDVVKTCNIISWFDFRTCVDYFFVEFLVALILSYLLKVALPFLLVRTSELWKRVNEKRSLATTRRQLSWLPHEELYPLLEEAKNKAINPTPKVYKYIVIIQDELDGKRSVNITDPIWKEFRYFEKKNKILAISTVENILEISTLNPTIEAGHSSQYKVFSPVPYAEIYKVTPPH